MNATHAHPPALNPAAHGVGARREWLIWFGAMAACLAVLGVLFLSDEPSAAGDVMMGLIALLFVATVVKSYRDILFLDRETRLASRQVRQLDELNDIATFLESASPSVFRAHIASLYSIFSSDSHITQDSLIEITHARLAARNRVVELLASILITLGLIGTILGLLIAVGGLGGVLGGGGGDGVGTEHILGHMRTTIDGLGTAFYTTLFGAVSGGVVLRILTSVVDANILRYVAHLSELSEVHVLPAMRRMASRLAAEGYYQRLDAR